MFYFLVAAYRGARRALVRDQGKDDPAEETFAQLLVEEFPVLARRIGGLRLTTILVVFFSLVVAAEILLLETTPGPVLAARWRLVVAALATLVFVGIWLIVHAVRSTGWDPPRRRRKT